MASLGQAILTLFLRDHSLTSAASPQPNLSLTNRQPHPNPIPRQPTHALRLSLGRGLVGAGSSKVQGLTEPTEPRCSQSRVRLQSAYGSPQCGLLIARVTVIDIVQQSCSQHCTLYAVVNIAPWSLQREIRERRGGDARTFHSRLPP